MAIATVFIMMGGFFAIGMYVAGALGVLSLVIMQIYSDAPLWNILGNKAWETNTNFILVAVPLFILMGELMLRSGMGERMYDSLSRWLLPLPGGLIHTNVVACTIFAACSGSSVATSATISRVSLPSFRARGYNEPLVVGSLAAGGTLGILIPPSIALIIYGVLVEESIGRLYMAGILPGVLLAASFMIMIGGSTLVFRGIAPRERWAPLRARLIGLLAMLPIAAIIFVVLGTIYLGWATPTEAAAFGVSSALILAVANNTTTLWMPLVSRMLTRTGVARLFGESASTSLRASDRPVTGQVLKDAVELNLKMLRDTTLSTVRTTAMIFLIVVAAFVLSFAFARLGFAHQISTWATDLNLNAITLVAVLVVFYLLLGTVMESLAMMVTTVPILTPVLIATGVDLVWFGIIMVILIEAALISPPMGMNLYIIHGVRKDIDDELSRAQGIQSQNRTMTDVWLGVVPFIACMAVTIILIMAFPQIALWLPDLMMGVR